MAYRTLYFNIEKATTTSSEGDKIDFLVSGENSAFGSNRPYYFDFEFNSSYLYANYASSVTMKWSLALKINGTRYEIYSDSSTMSKSDSDFAGSGYLPDNVINLLKSYPIDEVSVYQDGSRVIKGTSSAYGSMTINYEEIQPTLGTPGAPTITQNNNGTYTASWSAVSASNGSGSVQYRLWSVTDGVALSSYSTSTSVTLNIGAYDYPLQYRVQATYSGLTTNGSTTTKTFYKPSITAPSGLKVTSATAQTCALSWTAATLNYTSGTITYSIRRNGTEIATTTSTSYTVAESTTKGWGTSASTMTVVAVGSGLGNTASGSTLTSSATSGVSYTYRAAVTTHPSGLKINNTTSYTGATAPLTWSAAAFSGGQTPTYSIRVNGTQLTTTTSTSYTIPESTTKSYTSVVTITVVAIGGGATSNATNGVTYTYQPTITAPSSLKINSTTSYTGRTAPLTWTAGSLSNGGAVTYSIRKGGVEFATTTSTSYTVAESVTKGWGTSTVTLTVVAIGAGLTSGASNGVTYTYQPVFTANPTNLKINGGTSYTGQTAPLSWTAGSLSNGDAITYSLRKNGTQFTTTTSTSYTVAESVVQNWGTSAVKITVVATGSGLTSEASNEVSFTYKPPFKTVKYHTGSSFVECIGYYHNGTKWVKCDVYYHDGTGWKLSDH